MKSVFFLLLIAVSLSFVACNNKEENKPITGKAPDNMRIVKVEERVDASDYSYLQVSDKDGNKFWIAVTRMEAVKGDILYFSKSMEMKNFHSNTLNRDFESVLFVEDATKTPHNMNNGGQTTKGSQSAITTKEDIKVEQVKGGKTVQQIWAEKNNLSGKIVKLRGVVVKYNPEIMGKNWIHIQDGSGSGKEYDMMVTSNDPAEKGQTVVVEGKVAINKDFGAGYTYEVMIEDAKVTVEKKL